MKKALLLTILIVLCTAIVVMLVGCDDTDFNDGLTDIPNEDNSLIPISEGLEYIKSDDGTHYIVKGIGTCVDKTIVIPSTYQGLPVESIGDYAFNDCSMTGIVYLKV